MDPDHNSLGCPKVMQIGKTALLYPRLAKILSLRSISISGNPGGLSSRIIDFCPLSLGFVSVVVVISAVVTGDGVGDGVSTCSVGSSSK